MAAYSMLVVTATAQNPPFTLNWPDRRPIGFDVLGNRAFANPNNPRGYIQYSKSYISTSGKAQFRSDLLARAAMDVAVLKSINAQGIIIWDVEGDEPSFVYVGDPRQLSFLAPEMDAVADEFFNVYTAAGLRVGIMARRQAFGVGTNLAPNPTVGQVFLQPYPSGTFQQNVFVCYTNGTWFQTNTTLQQQTTNFYPDFLAKIEYAKNRWGATLFYNDSYSSYTAAGLAALSNVMVLHPDILLAPEAGGGISTTNTTTVLPYFSVCAPFLDPVASGCLVPGSVSSAYHSAFGLVKITAVTNVASIVNSMTNGNIMLVNDWSGFSIPPGTLAVSNALKAINSTLGPPTDLRVLNQ